MKIGFVGTKIRMDLVQRILDSSFSEIEPDIYVDDRYLYCSETADRLAKMRDSVDGMVFGGELQFEIYQDMFAGRVPVTHIRKDASSLVNAFLALSMKGVDITNISVDNFSDATIRQIMHDVGVKRHNIVILRRQAFRGNDEDYYNALFEQHRELYRSGKTQGCATTLSFVYERLCQAGVPASYMLPTTDNVVKTINHIKDLYREKQIDRQRASSLAVLSLRLTPREELAYQGEGSYADSHEKLLAAEEIHYFAKSTHAAVITQSDEKYTILMTREELMEYTNDLQAFPLLHFIRDNSKCDFQLGIGFGDQPGEARLNSVMALKKACRLPGCGTYIVYSNRFITGPMEFVNETGGHSVFERALISKWSSQTGISEDRLQKLLILMDRKKKPLFAISELANQLNVSVRTANRLVNQLEDKGLAKIAGQTNQGKAGRPGNVFELLLRTK